MYREKAPKTAKIAGEMIVNTHLKGWLDILIAFIPIFMLGAIGTSLNTGTFIGGMLVTLGYVISILIAGKVLRLRSSSWREVGLARPVNWGQTILLAMGTFVTAIVVFLLVQLVVLNLPGTAISPINETRFNPLKGNSSYYLLMLIFAWTTIAFGEEMFYRAFMINRLVDVFEGKKFKWLLALLTSSMVFGFVHIVEGPLGILNTIAFGLILGSSYLLSGRNLWITIIAHGLANTLRFTMLYLGLS